MSLDEALSEEVVEEVSTILTETLWWVPVLQLRDQPARSFAIWLYKSLGSF